MIDLADVRVVDNHVHPWRASKAVLGRVLEELVADGFCSRREAFQVARCILSDNAVRMYEL